MIRCETCGVNLCVHHFKLYHSITTLLEYKEKINIYIKQYYKDKYDKAKSDAANKANKRKEIKKQIKAKK